MRKEERQCYLFKLIKSGLVLKSVNDC